MPITFPKQTAASVQTPPIGFETLFLDSADSVLKTKDSDGNVTVMGVGTATELDTTAAPVVINLGGAVPAAGYFLRSTAASLASWQLVRLIPTLQQDLPVTGAITTGTGIGVLFRVDVTAGAATHILPSAVGLKDQQIEYKIIGLATFTLTITPAGAETIDGVTGAHVVNTDNEYLVLRSDDTNWMVMT